ncbi:hypothetical protein LguiA_035667 [Lonicera macranthoides]
MDSEIQIFIKIWLLAITSICYCYYVVSRLSKPIPRFLSLLPVISLFIFLPFSLSSVHFVGPTVFYLVWLANFKLLLFSFHLGPLSSPLSLSLFHFIAIALFPIKPKQSPNSTPTPTPTSKTLLLIFSIKVVLVAVIIRAYNFRQFLHPHFIYLLYCCHVYLGVELILAMSAAPFRAILGLDLEPQFNDPYLATSLQDFWGRRWNLMVTSILRPTVYNPVRRKWGQLAGVLATFFVSGIVHEVIYYYLTRVDPTWEVTWFFVLHGVCTAAEIAVKKAVGDRWRLHRAVSGPLTLVFVTVTAVWLFFPQIVRNGVDQKAIEEYGILIRFVRERSMFFTRTTAQ